jgi:tryptophan synthase alpha chain
MSRLSACFQSLQDAKRHALLTYMVGGDYDIKSCVSLMQGLVSGGADVIELGYPFSDPAAEGVVIQDGHQRTLDAGVRLADVLQVIAEFRKSDDRTPVVLMGYLNPVEQMGYEEFANRAAQAGADGALVVDLPMEQAGILRKPLRSYGLDLVLLSAPTTMPARVREIGKHSQGYLYCVTLKGLTGAGSLDLEAACEQITLLREHTSMPICAGFGIKTPQQAMEIARVADGVVVGSALVELIGSAVKDKLSVNELVVSLTKILKPIRAALDAAT